MRRQHPHAPVQQQTRDVSPCRPADALGRAGVLFGQALIKEAPAAPCRKSPEGLVHPSADDRDPGKAPTSQ